MHQDEEMIEFVNGIIRQALDARPPAPEPKETVPYQREPIYIVEGLNVTKHINDKVKPLIERIDKLEAQLYRHVHKLDSKITSTLR